MTHGTVLVHELAGSPAPAGWRPQDGSGVCAMCARTVAETMPAGKALGANFTDPTLWSAPQSVRVCAACTWCCAGRPPSTVRGWTILAAPGLALPASAEKAWAVVHDRPGLCVTNRSDPGAVAALLLDPPDSEWLCTVAVSGQKHTLPYTRVNRGGGAWTMRMETAHVTATPAAFRTVLRSAAVLRAAGHRAEDIKDAAPTAGGVKTAADLEAWRVEAAHLAGLERSGALDLALWCLTKTTIPIYCALESP